MSRARMRRDHDREIMSACRSRTVSKRKGEIEMPYATTSDKVRLYYEEAGSGTPVLFVMNLPAIIAMGATDALFFPAVPLHHLFRSGYKPSMPNDPASTRTNIDQRRDRCARSSQDRQGAYR